MFSFSGWLDDIGLPQYKSNFDEARVDGRMLHYMTVVSWELFTRFSTSLDNRKMFLYYYNSILWFKTPESSSLVICRIWLLKINKRMKMLWLCCRFFVLRRKTCCLWRSGVFFITSASREPSRFCVSTPMNPTVWGAALLMRYYETWHFCSDSQLSNISFCLCRATSRRLRSLDGPTTEWWSGCAPWIWQNTRPTLEGVEFMEDWWWKLECF